jgi:hypothetical protein
VQAGILPASAAGGGGGGEESDDAARLRRLKSQGRYVPY